MSLRLSHHKVLHNIASSSSFLDFAGIFSLFSLVFRTCNFLVFKELNKTIIPFELVGYETGYLLGSLSTRVFETRTTTGSELFSLLTCLHTTTFTFPSIFSPLEMISVKMWETPLSWHAKFSLPVAVRVSKSRVLKLPNK